MLFISSVLRTPPQLADEIKRLRGPMRERNRELLNRMLEKKSPEAIEIFNLGTGHGVSVLELIAAFEKATGVKVPHKIVGRREGDIEQVWANPEKANKVLGWTAQESIEDTLASAWKWQLKLRERGIM